MIAIFNCGSCGVPTRLHPPGKHVLDEVEQTHQVRRKDVIDGKVVETVEMKPFKKQVPRTQAKRQQNVFSGEMETVQVPVLDHGEVLKTVHLQLRVGDETVTKALCPNCYKKFEKSVEALWAKLAKLRSL